MKMNKMVYLLLLVFALTFIVSGCEAYLQFNLTGQVVDSADSTPIQGAKVSVNGKTVTTNKEGIYTINEINMNDQFVEVTFEKQGYEIVKETYTFPTITNTYRIDVGLAKSKAL